MLKNFSIKFIDIMIGIVLGLGFQWWTNLTEPRQYLAFVFAYIDIVDYWIDYQPSLKRFPPKKEIDVILDLAITFSLFLYIYTTQLTVIYFISAFILLKILDFLWLFSSKAEYHPKGFDKTFVNTWLKLNSVEIILSGLLILTSYLLTIPGILILTIFIIMRFVVRITAVISYKRVHLA